MSGKSFERTGRPEAGGQLAERVDVESASSELDRERHAARVPADCGDTASIRRVRGEATGSLPLPAR